jgi:hypothetical protein
MGSFFLVLVVRITAGTIEFGFLGFTVKGAAGPITMRMFG